MDSGTDLFRESVSDHSIDLYWVIARCCWIGGGVFGFPDPKTASGVTEEALVYELFQVSSESPTMVDLVPIMVRAVLSITGCEGSYWMGLGRLI